MDDETAYMELVRCNAQTELTALERGLHALNRGKDVKAYAESVGRARQSVSNEVLAARVAQAVPHVGRDLSNYFRHLTEIHAAPKWLWSALVERLVSSGRCRSWSGAGVRPVVGSWHGQHAPPPGMPPRGHHSCLLAAGECTAATPAASSVRGRPGRIGCCGAALKPAESHPRW